jgi:3-methyladenine DNA glycosylase Mpg
MPVTAALLSGDARKRVLLPLSVVAREEDVVTAVLLRAPIYCASAVARDAATAALNLSVDVEEEGATAAAHLRVRVEVEGVSSVVQNRGRSARRAANVACA